MNDLLRRELPVKVYKCKGTQKQSIKPPSIVIYFPVEEEQMYQKHRHNKRGQLSIKLSESLVVYVKESKNTASEMAH